MKKRTILSYIHLSITKVGGGLAPHVNNAFSHFFCMHTDKYCREALNTCQFSHYRKKWKNLSFSPCTFGRLSRNFLIKTNFRLHVPGAANFSGLLYRVRLNGCTQGITGFPETRPKSHMETPPGSLNQLNLEGLFDCFLVISLNMTGMHKEGEKIDAYKYAKKQHWKATCYVYTSQAFP